MIAAIFFLGMGVLGLLAPSSIVSQFGILLSNPAARSEVRAVYGGFGLAIGLLLLLGPLLFPFYDILAPGINLCLAVSLLGMAGARGFSILVEKEYTIFPNVFYMSVEICIAFLLSSS
jgi:hypothetical protein